MSNINLELRPVIELNLSCLNSNDSIVPKGDQFSNPSEWHTYYSYLLDLSEFSFKEFSVHGYPLLLLEDIIDSDDLKILVDKHVFDCKKEAVNEFETCPFFGGLLVYIDGVFVYKCQCCSLLNDFYGYKYLLEKPEYHNLVYLMDGHPAPIAKSNGSKIEIDCSHFFRENFERPSKSFEIDRKSLEDALSVAMKSINEFAVRIDKLSSLYGQNKISDQLIYDRDEYK